MWERKTLLKTLGPMRRFSTWKPTSLKTVRTCPMTEPKFCEVCGVNLAGAGSHYHCSNCWSLEPVSMIGHFIGKLDNGVMVHAFSCETRERPVSRCNQCGYKLSEHNCPVVRE